MPPWLASTLLIVGGSALLAWLARKMDPDPRLAKIVLWSYGVRVVLTLCLFFISFWRLPILRSLQMGDGFWTFGLDCVVYHGYGARIAEAWNLGIEFPDPGLGIEYFAVVALIYKLLGSAHPLYPALVNCLMTAASGLLAYLIVERLADRRAAFRSAALVSFWPSTLIWSTQLLKDSLSWILIFLVLWLVVRAVPRAHDRNRSAGGWVGLYLSLAITVIFVTRLRYYVGSALSLAALIVFVPVAVTALKEKRVARCTGSLGIVLAVVLSTLFARTLDTRKLLTPARPEVGHFRLGVEYWRRGNFQRTAEEFRRALALNANYRPAQFGIDALTVHDARFDEAAGRFRAYVTQEPPQRQAQINTSIAQIFATKGNQALGQAEVASAMTAFQFAATFDSSVMLPSAPSPAKLLAPSGNSASPESEVPQAAPIAPPSLPVSEQAGGDGLLTVTLRALTETLEDEGKTGERWNDLLEGVGQLDDYALMAAYEASPQELDFRRQGFILSRGHSLMDSGVEITDLQQLITYLPRALLIGVLAPFPWQWFDTKGSTGVMRTLAGIEMLCLYFLFPGILVSIWHMVKQGNAAGFFLLTFTLLLAMGLSLVVANLGTLFRLRLQFLLPLLMLAPAGRPMVAYRKLFSACRELIRWTRRLVEA